MNKKHVQKRINSTILLLCLSISFLPHGVDAGPFSRFRNKGKDAEDVPPETQHTPPVQEPAIARENRRFALDKAAVPEVTEKTAQVGDGLTEIQGVSFAMWGRIEPSAPVDGVPQYRGVDNLDKREKDFLSKFKQTGRELSVVLEFYYNDWALEVSDTTMVQSPRSGKQMPGFVRIKKEHEQDWKNFVKHYISIVPNLKYIQIDNEPENVWVNGEGYARAVRLAYEAVQEYNAQHSSDVKVMAAGFYLGSQLIGLPESVKEYLYKNNRNINETWLRGEINLPPGITSRQIQMAGQKVHVVMSTLRQKDPAFDILTIHLDGTKPYNDAKEVIKWYRHQMQSMGYDRPVWIDDMHSGYYPEKGAEATPLDRGFMEQIVKNNPKAIARNDREQPTWLVRKAAGYFAAGVDRIKIADLCDNPTYFMPEWRYTGLFNSRFEPKPSFFTTLLLVGKLDGFKTATKLHDYTYRFTFNNKDDIYVAWSEQGNRNLDLSREMGTPLARITHLINDVDRKREPVSRVTANVPSNQIPLTAEPVFIEKATL